MHEFMMVESPYYEYTEEPQKVAKVIIIKRTQNDNKINKRAFLRARKKGLYPRPYLPINAY